MKSFLSHLFLHNWPRKGLSLILAIIIWFVVNQSLTATKTISDISVKIIGIPPGQTVEGIQSNGLMKHKINLTLTGKKALLEDLNRNDLYVEIDAANQKGEWVASIGQKNLRALNPAINLSHGINKVSHKNFIIKLTRLVTEKIPIIITQPIGEAPKGYQFVDIWPYQLHITVSGAEEVIRKLKTRGIKLTFNLSDISKAQLDDLKVQPHRKDKDTVSYFVPNSWKQVSLPILSNEPIAVNDPNAKYLRIDFIRNELIPITNPVPVGLFFSPEYSGSVNPQKAYIGTGNLVGLHHGIKVLSKPMYARGVSELFVEIMRDSMQILIFAKSKGQPYDWSIQFVSHRSLEDRYISTLMSDVSDEELRDLQPHIREEYLRNRFRSYINRFELYTEDQKPFGLSIDSQGNALVLKEKSDGK